MGAWLSCVVLCVFQWIISMRSISWNLTPVSSICFEIGTPLMLISFAATSLGDAGTLPARRKHASGVEELMRLLHEDADAAREISFDRLCLSTLILKGPRTKYWASTDQCIEEFDHFCQWMNSAVGRGNHRMFFLHSFTQLLVLWSGFFASFTWTRELMNAHYLSHP